MAIERINIQTSAFTLRASNIRGPQLRTLVDSLRRAGAAAPTPSPVAGPKPGPGAIQSPAERFPQLGGSTGAGAPAGFAPGGSDQMRALDTNGFMRLIMQLLERLLESIFQMFSGGAGEAGNGGACNAAGSSGGAGGPGPAVDPTKPPSTGLGGSGGGAEPVPPRPNGGTCRPRARPDGSGKPSLARRLLSGLGRNAARVAPLAVPGGPLGTAAAQLAGGACAPPPRTGGPCPPSSQPRAGAGSLEDRIFEYLSSKLREIEGELEGAMQQQEAGGAAGGDSRSAAAQRVQQLVQKRSQMVELLSNSLKTLHDNSMAVNRNIRT